MSCRRFSARRRPAALGRSRLAFGVVVGLALLIASGCGKKGDPEPPIRLIPKAPTDLTVRQQGSEIELRCSYPAVAVNGMALPDLEGVEVWRLARTVSAGTDPPAVDARLFQSTAELVQTLTGDAFTNTVFGDRTVLRQPVETAEPASAGEPAAEEEASDESSVGALTYGLVYRSSRGERSAFTNLVTIVPRPAPAPIARLSLEPRATGIEISWSAGDGAESYHVYRRETQARTYGQPLATVDAGTERYFDASARYGVRYVYSVTAVAQAEPVIESALGGEREIDYRDTFAPEAPTGLVALAETGRVRLSWQAADDPDVAGYHVYRRDEGSDEFRRLTSAPIAGTGFLEGGLVSGRSYTYRVTAVDAEGNEGEPSGEAGAVVR